ncbi:MAG: putative GTPase [Planctomycetes bacterium]|nr:putative GTPase [Planctomycetota bacterium]
MTTTAPTDLRRRVTDLVGRVRAGDVPSVARALTLVENREAVSAQILHELWSDTGRAWRIGITGPPGAGKSTLVAALIAHFRQEGRTVGVIAVDPTSPFTGGALLGDRVRMGVAHGDPGVFIRSMASRGDLGGLCAAAQEACDVLDAAGKDVILIETVGVGQTEVEVVDAADSIAVVLHPESGDSVQAMKAGLMEIADVYAVNKADRPGADRLEQEILASLGLRPHGDGDWMPPVVRCVAATGEGVAALAAALGSHRERQQATGGTETRRARRVEQRIRLLVEAALRERFFGNAAAAARLAGLVAEVRAGRTTPYAAAVEVLGDASEVRSQHGREP